MFLCVRGTRILAGGIGVARLVVGAGFGFGFCCLKKLKSVCFACHATGLDAVQRLEQKEKLVPASFVLFIYVDILCSSSSL